MEAEKKSAALAKQKFEGQFSAWDGNHRGLVKAVKARMNNPKSFKHVETRYWYYADTGGGRVRMSFRGENSFGGTVTQTVLAEVSANGTVKILEIN